MPRQSDLTLEILIPFVQQGLNPKRIAYELGVEVRTVQRRLKLLGLKKSKRARLSERNASRISKSTLEIHAPAKAWPRNENPRRHAFFMGRATVQDNHTK